MDLKTRKVKRFRLSWVNYQLDKNHYESMGGHKPGDFPLTFYKWKWYVLWWGHTLTPCRSNDFWDVNLYRPEYV